MPALKQQNYPTDAAEDMSGVPSFTTGSMGGCDTVVVFWGYDATTHTYATVRGFHGGGGIQTCNFDSLMHNVPDGLPFNIASQPLVRVLIGPDNVSAKAHEIIKSHVKSELARLHYTKVRVQYSHGTDAANYLLRSDGSCQRIATH